MFFQELFKGHDKDRDALRKELQRQREFIHHMLSQNRYYLCLLCIKNAWNMY